MIIRTRPAQHMPYPELIEALPNAVPYRIVDSTGKHWLPTNGMTSLIERKLYLPLVDGATSVARHESGHVKWSPMQLPQVDYDLRALMAVEDARLNLGLALVELPVELTKDERATVTRLAREDLARNEPFAFVLRSIAALGTNVEQDILGQLLLQPAALRLLAHRHVRRVRVSLERGRRTRRAPVASFRLVLRLAEELARDLARELEALGYPKGLPFPLELAGAGCCLGHASARWADARAGRGLGAQDRTDPARNVESGLLRVVVAPLVHASPQARGGVRGRARATSEGSLPRFVHRWPIDGAIFRRTKRQRGGSVLIDTSGSMSLDAAGVDAILSASAGAALIAIYSGIQKEGELRIVARDGRRADARHLVPYGRGNIVDEPALEWLARQSEPRVWISDGGVTGVDDATSTALQQRCQEIVARSRARRVKNVAEAAACLARGVRHAGVA